MSALAGNSAWRALSDKPGRLLGQKVAEQPQSLLERVGIKSVEEVQAAIKATQPPDPVEALRLSVRHARKLGFGRRGLPRTAVRRMYLDYLRLGSLQKVGRLYDRTRQSVWSLFRSHFLPMNQRNLNARIIWGGEAWTPYNGGFRPTTGERSRLLHRAIWEKETGKPIPPGFQVTFRNGDPSDIRFENLICLSAREVSLFHYRRLFPDRAHLSPEQRRQMWKAHYRDLYRARSAGFKARGLRSDGKPFRRPEKRVQKAAA